MHGNGFVSTSGGIHSQKTTSIITYKGTEAVIQLPLKRSTIFQRLFPNLAGWWRKGIPPPKHLLQHSKMKRMRINIIPARMPPGLTRNALPLMAQGGSGNLAMGLEWSVKKGLLSLRIGSGNVSTMKRKEDILWLWIWLPEDI